MAILHLGEGYRTEFAQYRLFVEVEETGWFAAVRDWTKQKWDWKDAVGGLDEGQKLAIEKLLDNVTPEQALEITTKGLTWEHYGKP